MNAKCQWCGKVKKLISGQRDMPVKDANLALVCPWCDLMEEKDRPKQARYPDGSRKE